MSSSSARRPNSRSPHPSLLGSSADNSPRSSTQPSPTFNLCHEYTLAIHKYPHSEIWSNIHPSDLSYEDPDLEQGEAHEVQLLLEKFLRPSREHAQEVLQYARPRTLTRLFSAYFDYSENTFQLCLLLHNNVHRARSLYHDLHNFLDVLTLDSDPNPLTQSQCDQAFDIFLQFDRLENPFPHPDSHNFHAMHDGGFLLKQLHHQLRKSRATTCPAICFIGTVVGVSLSAVAIASHALIAIIAGPLLAAIVPSKITKKELAQLDTAAKSAYVLNNILNIIDCLVERLYSAVDCDKSIIHLVMERGRDKHVIHEVVTRLQKNHHLFLNQLTDLEENIYLYFAEINRARFRLLDEILSHQSNYS